MNVKETVDLLNELLWKGENNYESCFIYTQHGMVEAISAEIICDNSVITIQLWDCQNGESIMKYNEDADEYEPLEYTILREFNKCVKSLRKVSNHLNGV